MSYKVKEIYYTLQGEGANAGRPAVFCRFAGCNLWTGREQDRIRAKCTFCDTDFIGTDGPGGGTFASASDLAAAIAEQWPADTANCVPFVVFTGGEPLLQLDTAVLEAVQALHFVTAVETNGTITAPEGLDWITVSPKPGATLLQTRGNELKLVYPHEVTPDSVRHIQFEYFFLSPMNTKDAAESKKNMQAVISYCKEHPQWRMTMQYHKLWQIP